MTFEYKANGTFDVAVDPKRCKASVSCGGRSIRSGQCSRKAGVDGWCKQHHPDTVKANQDASMAKYRAKSKRRREALRLAAAAPDLLAACKIVMSPDINSTVDEFLREGCGKMGIFLTCQQLTIIRAAIDKAAPEEPEA